MDRKNTDNRQKSDPERLSIVLNAFITGDSAIQKRMSEVFRLKRLWVRLMGAHISIISSPYRIKDKVLFVSVYDSMWIAELPYIKSDMLYKLRNEGLVLEDIRFTLSKIYKNKTAAKPETKCPVPKEQLKWAERLSSVISDEKVRKSYLNALIAHIERHRL